MSYQSALKMWQFFTLNVNPSQSTFITKYFVADIFDGRYIRWARQYTEKPVFTLSPKAAVN